ncbi:MAG TPA: HD domain-containing protein [Chitinophagales bacterium]|nr:HD domain-containing protein [Chitinophagales bacterium]HRK26199.1 HD domain-containing protein [Chitinophagales bacterium]
MEEYILNLLKTQLPKSLCYHNYEHTLYVMDRVMEIGEHENCTPKELHLLRIAALFHDTGYLEAYEHNEPIGCRYARQYMQQYGYSTKDITAVCSMIMATQLPQTPTTKPEKVLADADLEYLGTPDAARQAALLYQELLHMHIQPTLTLHEWNKRQIEFISRHRYFTQYCQTHREHQKQQYLMQLCKEAE